MFIMQSAQNSFQHFPNPVHVFQSHLKVLQIKGSSEPYVHVSVIDQASGQDGWIFFACLWAETESRSRKLAKKNEANIQPSWPNKFGQ